MAIKGEEIFVYDIPTFANLHNIDRIDFLKIDTEGHDYDVILGALEMLKQLKITVTFIVI